MIIFKHEDQPKPRRLTWVTNVSDVNTNGNRERTRSQKRVQAVRAINGR